MVRAVLLDAGEVLVHLLSWSERLRRALSPAPWQCDDAALARGVDAALAWAAAHTHVDLLPDGEAEDAWALGQARAIAGALGVAGLDPRYLRDTCHNSAALAPLDDPFAVLPALRAAGLRLVVISDAPPSIRAALVRLGIRPLVDEVVLSSEVGALKPDPAMFRAALDKAGVEAGEAVFLDDLPGNVDGARAFGLARAWLVDRAGRWPDRGDRLDDLHPLPALLAGPDQVDGRR